MKNKGSQPQVKHYCCLYHFTAGKTEKSSSPCYNHVPLGTINPLPPSRLPLATRTPASLKLHPRPHSINYHTHDLNQIENRMSLPKRLAYPRIYVEELTQKQSPCSLSRLADREAFLKKKQFQTVFLLFQRFAKKTGFGSDGEVLKSCLKFAKSNKINAIPTSNCSLSEVYFQKSQLVNYLQQNGMTPEDAEQFWTVAFNQARTAVKGVQGKEAVSMKAFAYNYKKFYLDETASFRNCLSEAALRQRMIDLRLLLKPWFQRNIVFKFNYLTSKTQELGCCAQLKRYEEDTLYSRMLSMVEIRNEIWLLMRTLSKICYQVTDQKNIGLQVFNERATAFIQKHTKGLALWSQFMEQLSTNLASTGKSREQPFKITDLLQLAKSRFPEHMEEVLRYLRGVFKYLYFFEKSPLLSLNQATLNIDCNGIVEVSYNLLLEFLDYKRKDVDHLMEMVDTICRQVNETVESRPDVTGHKMFLHQCNYLAEALLKMIKRCDFSVFTSLQLVRELYLNGDASDTLKLKSILYNQYPPKESPKQITMSWKSMFLFPQAKETSEDQFTSKQYQLPGKSYDAALGAYNALRKGLEGRFSFQQKEKKQVPQHKGGPSQAISGIEDEERKAIVDDESGSNAEKRGDRDHTCFSSAYCSLCDRLCQSSLASSLNKIDSMSSYLLEILRDV